MHGRILVENGSDQIVEAFDQSSAGEGLRDDLGRRGLSDEAAVDELASSEDAVSEAAATKDTLSELDVYELRHDKQAPVPSRVLERAASADAFKAWPFNIEPVERTAPKRIV